MSHSISIIGLLAIAGCSQSVPISPVGTGTGWPAADCDLPRLTVPTPSDSRSTGTGVIRVMMAPPKFHLAALLTSYSAVLHHFNLRLTKQAPDGTYPVTPTATKLAVPANQLGSSITVQKLKLGATYRVVADAYASSTESPATLISASTGCTVTFTMPQTTVTTGVAKAEQLLNVAVPLNLLNQNFVGNTNYQLTVTNAKVFSVKLELSSGGVVLSSTTFSSPFPSNGTVKNLKMNTTYVLTASGLKNNGTVLTTATAQFTTPTLAANGTIDTGPYGPYSLVLN